MSGTLLVILIVGGNLIVQGVVWFFVIRMLRRRRLLVAQLPAQLAASGETIAHGPAPVGVRSGHLSWVAAVVLTDKRLIILGGKQQDIARGDIRSVSTARSFNGKITGGRRFVIIERTDASPIALQVKLGTEDHWKALLEQR